MGSAAVAKSTPMRVLLHFLDNPAAVLTLGDIRQRFGNRSNGLGAALQPLVEERLLMRTGSRGRAVAYVAGPRLVQHTKGAACVQASN